MFLVLTTYTADLDVVNTRRTEHVEYLRKLKIEGKLIVGGRKASETGAVLLFCVKNVEELQEILNNDPYAIHKLSKWEITEFKPGVYLDQLKDYFIPRPALL